MEGDAGRLLSSSINMIAHLGKRIPTFFLKTKILSMPQTTYLNPVVEAPVRLGG